MLLNHDVQRHNLAPRCLLPLKAIFNLESNRCASAGKLSTSFQQHRALAIILPNTYAEGPLDCCNIYATCTLHLQYQASGFQRLRLWSFVRRPDSSPLDFINDALYVHMRDTGSLIQQSSCTTHGGLIFLEVHVLFESAIQLLFDRVRAPSAVDASIVIHTTMLRHNACDGISATRLAWKWRHIVCLLWINTWKAAKESPKVSKHPIPCQWSLCVVGFWVWDEKKMFESLFSIWLLFGNTLMQRVIRS